MIKSLPWNLLRFFMIALAQVLVFNNIEISGYITPYIYLLFILLLPFETPKWIVLVLGFILGLTMDIFSETLGMHTAATTFAAYLRPFVLRVFAPREGYDTGILPRIHYLGLNWFIRYAVIIVVAHHLVLFYSEMFRFQNFFFTLFRVIISSVFSIFIIVFSQYFVYRK